MGFVGIHVEGDGFIESVEGLEHAFGVDGEGAGVGVFHTVVHEHGSVELIGPEQGRHGEIDFAGVPEIASFALETHGGEGAVVGAVAGDTGFEEGSVGEGVTGAEGAVAVSADGESIAVDVLFFVEVVDDGPEAVAQILDIVVVHLAGRSEDGDVGFDDDIIESGEDLHVAGAGGAEGTGVAGVATTSLSAATAGAAVVGGLGVVFAGIEPEDGGQLLAFMSGSGDINPELVAIDTGDLEAFGFEGCQIGGVIDIVG